MTPPSFDGNARVLIVEDEVITATIAGAICKELGCVILAVRDGVEAVSTFRQFCPDIVFMDLQLPVMGGFEATYEIRRIEAENRMARTPIIAVTGTIQKDNREKSLKSGMDDCVAKPYTIQLVQRLLAHWVPSKITPDNKNSKPTQSSAGVV